MFFKKKQKIIATTLVVFGNTLPIPENDFLRDPAPYPRITDMEEAVLLFILERENADELIAALKAAADDDLAVEVLGENGSIAKFTAAEFRIIHQRWITEELPHLMRVSEKLDLIGPDANVTDLVRLLFAEEDPKH